MDGEPVHLWRVETVEFGGDGASTTYRCDLCDVVLVVPPGGTHPDVC